ncbi:MAG: cupredoxin domain-containing protein [bacterium]|nr:cupredoxin domain-containing protein [bacterium]
MSKYLLTAAAAIVLLGAGCVRSQPAPEPAAQQEAATFIDPSASQLPDLTQAPQAPPTAADATPTIPIPPPSASPASTDAPPILPPLPDDKGDNVNASPRPSRTIVVTAKKWAFEPAEIRITKGETVVLEVKSVDVDHGLLIPALNINEKLESGKTVRIELTPNEAGTFPMICNVYCGANHSSMRGTIIVE